MALDAAILFSDIMVPLAAVGVAVRIETGVRPARRRAAPHPRPTSSGSAPLEPETDVPDVLEAIRLLRKELDVPLIGFAGAPFTLASYLVEGGPSRTHERTKALMFGEPGAWDALMDALVAIVLPHLRAQAEAGAQALQVFDSWVGRARPRRLRALGVRRTCGPVRPAWRTSACPRSISASGPASCSPTCGARAAT